MVKIGVLALQGAFIEHVAVLKKMGIAAVLIKTPRDLEEEQVDGLILPGGESSANGKLGEFAEILNPLRNWVQNNKPVYGTCSGMIMLADKIKDLDKQPHIGGLNITVDRNYFGPQICSFVTPLEITLPGNEGDEIIKNFPGVFIRAPAILSVGEGVEVLSVVQKPAFTKRSGGEVDGNKIIVAAKQNNILCSAFHPELTENQTIHRYFIGMVKAHRENNGAIAA